MRNILVLFHVDSKFLPHFVPFRSVRHRSCCHCYSCHRSLESLCRCVCEERRAQLLSPLMNSYYFPPQLGSTVFAFGVQYTLSYWQNWSAGQAKARAIPHFTYSRDVKNQWRWDRHQQKAPKNSVQEDLPHEESVRGNRAWQLLRDGTIRRCQYAKPFLLSGVTEECLCAHTWRSCSVAAFPRQSSLWPWSALASGNTWVARAGFPRKSIKWGWARAADGENQEGSPCGASSWASVCRGLGHRWSWCRWPSVASSDKSVLLGGC